jgi:membrane protein implicated in regulation of membrane protease activity
MDPFWIALAFVIAGIIMIIAEYFVPGSFIIVPGTVVLVLGIIWLINDDWMLAWWSILVAIVVVIPMIFVSIKLYQKLAPPAPPETTVASSLIGKKGTVLKEIVPGGISGKVRIDNDTWSATADIKIPIGADIVVVESTGVHVKVAEAAKK